MEAETDKGASGDYISRFREFKYQEALFELFSRQYELARVDEAREGALFQVVDVATAPERKSRPSRTLIGLGTTAGALVMLSLWVLAADALRLLRSQPERAERLSQIKRALRGH
jgi:uncharacterized protein involved in exopolysaccharide biosynthesis